MSVMKLFLGLMMICCIWFVECLSRWCSRCDFFDFELFCMSRWVVSNFFRLIGMVLLFVFVFMFMCMVIVVCVVDVGGWG